MQISTLWNGLRIILDKRDDLRSATVGVWVAAGSRFEEEKNNGISHFIEHIVFKGSKNRTGYEIAEGMDEIGAHVNAYTTKNYTFFYTKALHYQVLKAADILFDMILNPRLDEKDIETEKGVVIEEINMCEDDPNDVVYEINEESVFRSCSLKRTILGTRESVKALTADMIRDYMKNFYLPERMVVGISGNFDERELTQKILEYFSPLGNKAMPLIETPVPFEKGVFALKEMQTEQTHIMMCFEGVALESEDLYALQLCMFILGTGTSSMLYQRIREQLGLVYSIDSWLGRYLGGGYIAVSMSLAPSSEEKAIKEVIKIISEFCDNVTEKQVAIAKEKLISSLIMSREQPQSKFSSMGYNLLLLSKVIEDDEIIDEIKKVTLEVLKEAAKKYLLLKDLSFTAVGKVKSEEEYRQIVDEARG